MSDVILESMADYMRKHEVEAPGWCGIGCNGMGF